MIKLKSIYNIFLRLYEKDINAPHNQVRKQLKFSITQSYQDSILTKFDNYLKSIFEILKNQTNLKYCDADGLIQSNLSLYSLQEIRQLENEIVNILNHNISINNINWFKNSLRNINYCMWELSIRVKE